MPVGQFLSLLEFKMAPRYETIFLKFPQNHFPVACETFHILFVLDLPQTLVKNLLFAKFSFLTNKWSDLV